jgi:AcrR family transcriptional regulator
MANHERGIETRNTLLDTSLALFSQNGYDATSVAQICQDAQVSKGRFTITSPPSRSCSWR